MLPTVFRGFVWGLGTIIGPAVGGALELYSWRWCFYINLCFGAVLLPTYFFVMMSTKPTSDLSNWARVANFDWVGAVLSIAGFTVLIIAIQFGGLVYAWKSGSIIALLVVGVLLWVVFGVQQSFNIFTSPENRVFPVHLMKNKEAVLLFLIGVCVATISYVDVYYIPIYFQFTRGDSAIRTALRMLPFILLLILLILSSGFLMSWFGYYKPWYIGGSAIALVGSILLCKLTSTPRPLCCDLISPCLSTNRQELVCFRLLRI